MSQIPIYFNGALAATTVLASGTAPTTTAPGAGYVAGVLDTALIQNPNAALSFVQLFDAAATSAVTLGTTTPTAVIPCASNAITPVTNLTGMGLRFRKGIVAAATTTATGNTGVSTGLVITLSFQ
jgi:hypothetical protein